MIAVSKMERKKLEEVGLLRSKRTGLDPQEANYVIANKFHKSRTKKCYVTEEPDILLFLQKYDKLNLQKVKPYQIKKLKDMGLLTDNQIQLPGEYKPGALAFQDNEGQWRIRKNASLMTALQIWKNKN